MRSTDIGATASAAILAVSLAGCTVSTMVQQPSPPALVIPPLAAPVIAKAALSGQKQKLAQFYSVTPDCASNYKPIIKVLRPPLNGRVSVEDTTGFPNFPKENIRSVCNTREVPMVAVYYTSNANYLGADTIAFDEMDSMGNLKKYEMKIDVR